MSGDAHRGAWGRRKLQRTACRRSARARRITSRKAACNPASLPRILRFAIERHNSGRPAVTAKEGKLLTFIGARGGAGTTTVALKRCRRTGVARSQHGRHGMVLAPRDLLSVPRRASGDEPQRDRNDCHPEASPKSCLKKLISRHLEQPDAVPRSASRRRVSVSGILPRRKRSSAAFCRLRISR